MQLLILYLLLLLGIRYNIRILARHLVNRGIFAQAFYFQIVFSKIYSRIAFDSHS